MSIYGKEFEYLLHQNQNSSGLETWHVLFWTQALQGLYKWCPCIDRGLIYVKIKLDRLHFWMGKNCYNVIEWGKFEAKD